MLDIEVFSQQFSILNCSILNNLTSHLVGKSQAELLPINFAANGGQVDLHFHWLNLTICTSKEETKTVQVGLLGRSIRSTPRLKWRSPRHNKGRFIDNNFVIHPSC